MNTDSIDCRRVADFDAIEKPGDFYFSPVEGMGGDTCLHISLPGGAFVCIAVSRAGNTTPNVWGWDGNEERPTLTPSINCIDRWHGWLEAGRLRSC